MSRTLHGMASLLALLLVGACDADVRRTDPDDENLGDAAANGGDDAGDIDAEDEDRAAFAMCPEPPARPGGLRDGGVPSGAQGAEEARATFQRASHEMGHLVTVLLAEPGEATSDLIASDGTTLTADRDGEALRGTIARDAATGRVCAAVVFGSWTGGHGGWGLSALDGTMLLLVEGEQASAVGSLGLVESGALDGAARAEVRVERDGELLSGSVDDFVF